MKTFWKIRNYIIIVALVIVSICAAIVCVGCNGSQTNKAIVYQSDFGLEDGAVSAMKGVAFQVDNDYEC